MDSLRRIVRELRVFSRRAEEEFGLTAAQLFVLQRIAEKGPLSVNELAELTLTHQSTVSVVAQRLEEKGFIQRRRSEKDGRQKDLTITPTGAAALKRSPVTVQDRLICAAMGLPQGERETLARLLEHLVRAIGSEDARVTLFFEQEDASPPPDAAADSRGNK